VVGALAPGVWGIETAVPLEPGAGHELSEPEAGIEAPTEAEASAVGPGPAVAVAAWGLLVPGPGKGIEAPAIGGVEAPGTAEGVAARTAGEAACVAPPEPGGDVGAALLWRREAPEPEEAPGPVLDEGVPEIGAPPVAGIVSP
jgi:hypothetical protein